MPGVRKFHHLFLATILFNLFNNSISNLEAKKYSIPTNHNQVTCTLNTLEKNVMQKLIGDFPPYFVSAGKVSINNHESDFKRKEDAFHEFTKRYMAVTVTIENKSNAPIVIEKNEYLDGTEDFYISKEEFISSLYPGFKDAMKDNITKGTIKFICGALMSICMGAMGYNLYTQEPVSSSFREDDFFGDINKKLAVLFGLFGGGVAVAGAVYGYEAFQSYKVLGEAGKKEQNILRKTFLGNLSGSNKRAINPNSSAIVVNPNEVFNDIFFVDLERAPRSIFKKMVPTLITD